MLDPEFVFLVSVDLDGEMLAISKSLHVRAVPLELLLISVGQF